jgi:uncharacterized protein (DUF1684 family)
MRSVFFGCLLAAGVISACSTAPPSPVSPAATSDALVLETDAWHTERVERLTAPDGWLSLVGLEWLQQGRNRVGRGENSEIVYRGFPADHVGTFLVTGDRIRFEADGGVEVEGVPQDGVVRTDADGEPTVLSIGEIRFYVIVRGGRPVVRIKDASAPTRSAFTGIDRYRVDESWRIKAAFVPARKGELIGLDTVIGVREEGEIAGRARFEVQGVQVDAVLLDAGDGGSLLRFGDATNGRETYAVGRYLYVPPSIDGETVLLDFNRAYNPPCAFTPFATCTIPPASNDFTFAVRAGERWDGQAKSRQE